MIKTNFLGNDVPKEHLRYTCIAFITFDCVFKRNKKHHPQVYVEKCKYRTKKIQTSRFINTELKSDSDSSDSDSSDIDSEKIGAKVDNELMTKLESGSDYE